MADLPLKHIVIDAPAQAGEHLLLVTGRKTHIEQIGAAPDVNLAAVLRSGKKQPAFCVL